MYSDSNHSYGHSSNHISHKTNKKMTIFSTNVTSSNIVSVGYNDETSELLVTFHSGKQYAYSGVAEEKYREMIEAESVGKYFTQNIKNNYGYRQI